MNRRYQGSSSGASIKGTGTLWKRLWQHGLLDEPMVGFLVALWMIAWATERRCKHRTNGAIEEKVVSSTGWTAGMRRIIWCPTTETEKPILGVEVCNGWQHWMNQRCPLQHQFIWQYKCGSRCPMALLEVSWSLEESKTH
jgi:hypothetical protein